MKKFEVRQKNDSELHFGIWNNEMAAWQYVAIFGGTGTVNKQKAGWYCSMLNKEVVCHECKRRLAVTDYNGHGCLVCSSCSQRLNSYFDEECR